MQCPGCGNKQNSNIECERCGIIFKKYALRQQRLADVASAKQEQDAKKKKSLSGLTVGLIVGLTIGGAAFFYFGKSPKTIPPPTNITAAPTQQNRSSEPNRQRVPTKQKPTAYAPLQQNKDNALEGLAAQLNESHPANTAIEKARNATVFIKTS